MSTGRICPCLTEAEPEAAPAAPGGGGGGGTVMDDGGGSGAAAGDWGPDNDDGQAENTVRHYTGKIRAFFLQQNRLLLGLG